MILGSLHFVCTCCVEYGGGASDVPTVAGGGYGDDCNTRTHKS